MMYKIEIRKKKRGCEIFVATPLRGRPVLIYRQDIGEAGATAEAECEIVVCNVIFRSFTYLAPSCLHFFVPRHRFAAAANEPPDLFAEDSWIGFVTLLADVFPFWFVVKASAPNTHDIETPLNYRFVISHSNPPFFFRLAPVFLGTT